MTRKVFTFDIESAPAKVYTWSLFKPFLTIDNVIEPGRMICWAGKWEHEKRTLFFSEYHHSREEMLQQLHAALNDADVVVTFNGDNYDIRHVNREFIEAGLPPVSPSVSVDLYKVARKNFNFLSNKLAWVTQRLELSGKLSHSGFRMWRECNGDFGEERQHKAWGLMRRYCKQDVGTTEELFVELKPYITNLPSPHLFDENADELSCSSCEGSNVQRRGYAVKQTRKYPRYQCTDCGRWSTGTRSVGSVGLK